MPARPRNSSQSHGRHDAPRRAGAGEGGPRTPEGAKRRWTADDRAGRSAAADRRGTAGRSSTARTASDGSRAARRAAQFGEADGPRTDRRPDWSPGPRNGGRSARPQHDERGGRDRSAPRDDRDRDARQGVERGERPARDARAERPARESRPFREQRSSDGPRPFRGTDRGDARDRRRGADHGSDDRRGGRFEDRRPSRTFDDRRPAQAERGHARADAAPRWVPQEDVVLERLDAEVVTPEDVAGSSFADLGLGQQITRALAELGATSPFPIQAATIPAALAGRNVLGRGRTGSGKTIAFGAALVERLMRTWAESGRTGTGRRMGRAPRALILAPTRELALQIDRTVQPISRSVGLFTTQIVGGVPQGRQVGALAKGVDIVIGTPGRIEDLLEQGRLDLSEIEIAVLDEADHMAELGFLEPMQRLLARIPAGGQRLMFSATLDSAVAQLVEEFLPDPAVHEVADPEGSGSSDHRVLIVESGTKLPVLTALLAASDRTLVFARTRAFAEQLADELDGEGVKTESLHGDLNQARRTRNLARFSEGRVSALVATDVAARGIHVDDVDLVVHADAAEDYKTYLHRSGRTGRAGASGTVVTLINARRRRRFTELLERAGIEAEFVVLQPGDDPVKAIGR